MQNPLNPPLKPKRVYNQAQVIESSGVFVSFGRVVKFHASHFNEVCSRYYISSPMRKAMQVDAKQVMEVEEVEADGEVATFVDETIAEATC